MNDDNVKRWVSQGFWRLAKRDRIGREGGFGDRVGLHNGYKLGRTNRGDDHPGGEKKGKEGGE